MNYKELLKKYWFVVIVGIVLIAFIGVYSYDAYQNKELIVPAKDVDGKSVVYSVDDQYVFADDLYSKLANSNGNNSIMSEIQKIAVTAIETTDDMTNVAQQNAQYVLQMYGEEYMNSILKQRGYLNGTSDLVQFLIDNTKIQTLLENYADNNNEFIKDYIINHPDTFDSYQQENDARLAYHILIKVADVTQEVDENNNTVYTANPTAEEQKKLDDALAALQTKSFAEVANEYSEDTGPDGYVGCVSKSTTQWVAPFTSAALELEVGEISDVVTSPYGYHIIYNAGNTAEELAGDNLFQREFILTNSYLQIKAIMEKFEGLGYKVLDDNFNKFLTEFYESEENY